jgi:hypothetical protein
MLHKSLEGNILAPNLLETTELHILFFINTIKVKVVQDIFRVSPLSFFLYYPLRWNHRVREFCFCWLIQIDNLICTLRYFHRVEENNLATERILNRKIYTFGIPLTSDFYSDRSSISWSSSSWSRSCISYMFNNWILLPNISIILILYFYSLKMLFIMPFSFKIL